MDWQEIVQKLRHVKENFDRSYKCLNTDRPTTEETIDRHFSNLFSCLEQIRVIVNVNYERLTSVHKTAAEAFYHDVRTKLLNVADRKGINVEIPNTHDISIKIPQSFSLEEIKEIEEDEMATQTVVEFVNMATRLIPDFDGRPENLRSFLDALSLVEALKGAHEAVAVTLIKTKLKGNARNLITNECTLISIIEKLKSTVKGESTEVITAKIMNIKQNNKSANAYTEEIENLTKSLENAYLSDGLPTQTASKYAIQTAVKAMTKNCSHDRVKLVMEAGNFESLNDAVSKFVNCCTDVAGQNSVFQVRHNFRGRYNRKNYRGKNQRGNQGRSNYRGGGRNNYYGQNYNSENSRNDNRNGRGHQRRNNVRITQQETNRTENQQTSSIQ